MVKELLPRRAQKYDTPLVLGRGSNCRWQFLPAAECIKSSPSRSLPTRLLWMLLQGAQDHHRFPGAVLPIELERLCFHPNLVLTARTTIFSRDALTDESWVTTYLGDLFLKDPKATMLSRAFNSLSVVLSEAWGWGETNKDRKRKRGEKQMSRDLQSSKPRESHCWPSRSLMQKHLAGEPAKRQQDNNGSSYVIFQVAIWWEVIVSVLWTV